MQMKTVSQKRHTRSDADGMCAQQVGRDIRAVIMTVHMHNESDKTHVQKLRLHTCTVSFVLLVLLIP